MSLKMLFFVIFLIIIALYFLWHFVVSLVAKKPFMAKKGSWKKSVDNAEKMAAAADRNHFRL